MDARIIIEARNAISDLATESLREENKIRRKYNADMQALMDAFGLAMAKIKQKYKTPLDAARAQLTKLEAEATA